MNHSSFFITCLVAGMLGVPAAAQPGYQVRGIITGLADTWAYLGKVDGGRYRRVDSAQVRQGKFFFAGMVPEPAEYVLEFREPREALPLVLENKVITVQGQAAKIGESTITGSPLTDEASAYRRKYADPLLAELLANTTKADELRARDDSAGARQMMASNVQMMQQQFLVVSEYIFDHPEAFWSLSLLHGCWEQFGLETSKKMLHSLAPQWQDHSLARALRAAFEERERLAEKAQTGAPFADFRLPDANGQAVDLASLRGKYVFIDFWASWCGPCRAENPNLVKAYRKFKGKPFEIVGISLDEKKEPWLKAIEKDKLPWVHLSDLKGWKNDLVLHYGIKWIPSSFLLDPEGRIIARDLRGDALDKMLSEVFR